MLLADDDGATEELATGASDLLDRSAAADGTAGEVGAAVTPFAGAGDDWPQPAASAGEAQADIDLSQFDFAGPTADSADDRAVDRADEPADEPPADEEQ